MSRGRWTGRATSTVWKAVDRSTYEVQDGLDMRKEYAGVFVHHLDHQDIWIPYGNFVRLDLVVASLIDSRQRASWKVDFNST